MTNERSSLIDHNISSIKDYVINSVIGHGGSSIIYKCHSKKIKHKYYIIKELYPLALNIKRNDKGFLVVPEESNELWFAYKSNALSEITKTAEIGADGDNNDDFVFQIVDSFEDNNTIYTVIETSSGSVFTDEVDYCDKVSGENSDAVTIIDHVLKLLNTLSVIHNKGYLHLDISPDNIYISSGTNTLRLIDYNSAIKLKNIKSNLGLFSFKSGFSAPELVNASSIKTDIGTYTDLYSVCAVLYRILCGRTVTNQEIRFNEWNFADNKFCSKMPRKAIDILKKIFKNGLADFHKRRFQTCEELIDELVKLKNLCIGKRMSSNIQYPSLDFVGRTNEVEQIHEDLNVYGAVMICGMPGVGKTELVKEYATLHINEYESIWFASYSDSLEKVISEIEFEDAEVESSSLSVVANEKLNLIKKLSSDYLIVIDDFNLDEEEFMKLKANDNFYKELINSKAKIILINRNTIDVYGSIKISELSSQENLVVFKNIYRFNDEEKQLVEKIISIAGNNTFIVESIARLVGYGDTTLDECYHKLNSNSFSALDEKISIYAQGGKYRLAVHEYMASLINVSEFSDADLFVLKNLYCFPASCYVRKMFFKLVGLDETTNIEHLISKGYIKFDSATKKISLHPLISNFIELQIRPVANDVDTLLSSLIERLDSIDSLDISDKKELVSVCVQLTHKIDDISGNYLKFLLQISENESSYFYDEDIINVCCKLINLLKELDDEETRCVLVGKTYAELGEAYGNIGNKEKQKDNFHIAEKYFESVNACDNLNAAPLWVRLASLYQNIGEHNIAFEYFNKAKYIFDVRNETNVKLNTMFATFYIILGNKEKAYQLLQEIDVDELGEHYDSLASLAIAYLQVDNEKALFLLTKALNIAINKHGYDSPNLYNIYIMLATCCMANKNYIKAYYFYKRARNVVRPNSSFDATAMLGCLSCFVECKEIVVDNQIIQNISNYLSGIAFEDVGVHEYKMYSVLMMSIMKIDIDDELIYKRCLSCFLRVYKWFDNSIYYDFLKNNCILKSDIEYIIMFLYYQLHDSVHCVMFANKYVETLSNEDGYFFIKNFYILVANSMATMSVSSDNYIQQGIAGIKCAIKTAIDCLKYLSKGGAGR